MPLPIGGTTSEGLRADFTSDGTSIYLFKRETKEVSVLQALYYSDSLLHV